MPLVGVKCCHGGEQKLTHCISQCRNGKCLFPMHILRYMAGQAVDRRDVGYSATSIIGCARRQVLQQRVDYAEDPNDVVNRFVGDAVHHYAHVLLAEEQGYVGEDRVWAELAVDLDYLGLEPKKLVLSGKTDQRWFKTKIVDLKTTGEIPSVAHPDHVAQVNIYAWLLRHGYDQHGFPTECEITEGQVTYISTPQKRMITWSVPIWPDERTRAFIDRRLQAYAPLWADGEYPEILRPSYELQKDKHYTVKRDYRCSSCPVRSPCDAIGLAERGVHPNEYGYWEPVAGEVEKKPVFVEGF